MDKLKHSGKFSLWYREENNLHTYEILEGYLLIEVFQSRDTSAYKEVIKRFNELTNVKQTN